MFMKFFKTFVDFVEAYKSFPLKTFIDIYILFYFKKSTKVIKTLNWIHPYKISLNCIDKHKNILDYKFKTILIVWYELKHSFC